MTKDLQDHRDYYRIQDKVYLDYVPVEQKTIEDAEQPFPLNTSPRFQLLNELQQLDTEHNNNLRALTDKDRLLGGYLQAINHKLEAIARAVASIQDTRANADEDDDESPTEQWVTLSEGGMSFNSKAAYKLDSFLALKLTLLPSYYGLQLYGRVVNCNESIRGDYLINLEFEYLEEFERQLLARHVLQHQAQQRRENLAKVTPLFDEPPTDPEQPDA